MQIQILKFNGPFSSSKSEIQIQSRKNEDQIPKYMDQVPNLKSKVPKSNVKLQIQILTLQFTNSEFKFHIKSPKCTMSHIRKQSSIFKIPNTKIKVINSISEVPNTKFQIQNQNIEFGDKVLNPNSQIHSSNFKFKFIDRSGRTRISSQNILNITMKTLNVVSGT